MLATRFEAALTIAMGSAVMSAVIGTIASFHLDGATGPCMVLMQAAQFRASRHPLAARGAAPGRPGALDWSA
jgi:ABC-type Mn2+/Zn2+ transport system permease subunit